MKPSSPKPLALGDLIILSHHTLEEIDLPRSDFDEARGSTSTGSGPQACRHPSDVLHHAHNERSPDPSTARRRCGSARTVHGRHHHHDYHRGRGRLASNVYSRVCESQPVVGRLDHVRCVGMISTADQMHVKH